MANPLNPRVTDNDKGEISVALGGRELRGWSYSNDTERRQKMIQAREYIEGWCDGRDALKNRMDILSARCSRTMTSR